MAAIPVTADSLPEHAGSLSPPGCKRVVLLNDGAASSIRRCHCARRQPSMPSLGSWRRCRTPAAYRRCTWGWKNDNIVIADGAALCGSMPAHIQGTLKTKNVDAQGATLLLHISLPRAPAVWLLRPACSRGNCLLMH
jgi:hypothetical protein